MHHKEQLGSSWHKRTVGTIWLRKVRIQVFWDCFALFPDILKECVSFIFRSWLGEVSSWTPRLKNGSDILLGNITQQHSHTSQKKNPQQHCCHSFIHSFIGMCTVRWFLAVLRSFFHSSLLCNFSLHPVTPPSISSFLTLSCHLFLGLPISLVVSKFILKTFLGILFSSILCTYPNQCNLFSLIVSATVGF